LSFAELFDFTANVCNSMVVYRKLRALLRFQQCVSASVCDLSDVFDTNARHLGVKLSGVIREKSSERKFRTNSRCLRGMFTRQLLELVREQRLSITLRHWV